jgi:hypothetical protein
MSNLTIRKHHDLTNSDNEHSVCIPDNITSIPKYHINDSLSYQVSGAIIVKNSGMNSGLVMGIYSHH